MTFQDSNEILRKIKKTKILVLGDVLLDLYIRGEAHRISPEAPVPIILESSQEYSLGGAGNVAHNISAVGGQVTLVGVVGKDKEADIVRKLSLKHSIRPRLLKDNSRHTPLKIRAVAGQHQLLRIDREHVHELQANIQKNLFRQISGMEDHDFVIISDYVKGFVTKNLVEAVKKRFGRGRIIANFKPSSKIANYKNIAVVTLNMKEGYDLTRIYGNTDLTATQALKKLNGIFQSSIVMTRGEQGLSIFDKANKKIHHISSPALHVFDVTGAGDTIVAIIGILLGTGVPLSEAAVVANRAAGIVVGMPGTTVLSPLDFKNILNT